MNNTLAKKKKKGFTLIELIIVLAVMAIIAAIAIPSFSAIRDNAAVKADEQSKATVERTVLMLAADEKVTTGKFIITPADPKPTVIKGTGDGTSAEEVAVADAITLKSLKKYKTITIEVEGQKVKSAALD